MGMFTGGTEGGMYGDQAAAYEIIGVRKQVPLVRAVAPEGRSRGMAGGTAVRHGGAGTL